MRRRLVELVSVLAMLAGAVLAYDGFTQEEPAPTVPTPPAQVTVEEPAEVRTA